MDDVAPAWIRGGGIEHWKNAAKDAVSNGIAPAMSGVNLGIMMATSLVAIIVCALALDDANKLAKLAPSDKKKKAKSGAIDTHRDIFLILLIAASIGFFFGGAEGFIRINKSVTKRHGAMMVAN